MCILPRYGSPHGEPVSSLAETFCRLCCVVILTPGWLSLPQSLPYVTLPLASPYVFSTWYLLYAGCGFRSVPLLGVRFPSVSIPTVRNSSVGHLCLSPVLSSVPLVWGDLPARRALEGVSNSGVFQRDPISQSL